jgi:hypothetical protein
MGQFLTHDPAGQFASPYAYGPGDPVNGTDPRGQWFLTALLSLIGLGAVSYGIQSGDWVGAVVPVLAESDAYYVGSLLASVSYYAPIVGVGLAAYGLYETIKNGNAAMAVVAGLGVVLAAYSTYSWAAGLSTDQAVSGIDEPGRSQRGGIQDTQASGLPGLPATPEINSRAGGESYELRADGAFDQSEATPVSWTVERFRVQGLPGLLLLFSRV